MIRMILVPKVWHLHDLHTFGLVTSHELSIQLSVEGELHQHRHHAVVLKKLSLDLSWIKSSWDVTELNVCRWRRCRAFGT